MIPIQMLNCLPIYDVENNDEKYFYMIKELIMRRIESISNKDLNDINIEVINSIICKIKSMPNCSSESFFKQLEDIDLHLAFIYKK